MVALFCGRNSRPEGVEKLSSARHQQGAVNALQTEKPKHDFRLKADMNERGGDVRFAPKAARAALQADLGYRTFAHTIQGFWRD
jgi:hypothetical protein